MYYLLTENDIETKILKFCKILQDFSLREINVDYSFEYRIIQGKLIFNLRSSFGTFENGRLELWYYIDKGYYWCRLQPDNSTTKISSATLKLELIQIGIKEKFDLIFDKLQEVFKRNILVSFEEFKVASIKNNWERYYRPAAVDFHFNFETSSKTFKSSITYPLSLSSRDVLLKSIKMNELTLGKILRDLDVMK